MTKKEEGEIMDRNETDYEKQMGELKVEYNDKIEKLESCLHDKDRRLKKVEYRWKYFIWIWLSAGIASCVVIMLNVIRYVVQNLPSSIISNPPNATTAWTVINWWLLFSITLVSVFSLIGLISVIIFLYIIFYKD